MKVYLVCESNCEEWEDYSWDVESAWVSREDAVSHIESSVDDGGLGMSKLDWGGHDRWHRVCFDGDADAEFVEEREAWVEEHGVNVPDGGPDGRLTRDELLNLCQWLWREWLRLR